MTPEEQAWQIFREVQKIQDKWRTENPCFHERLLTKDICLWHVSNRKNHFVIIQDYENAELYRDIEIIIENDFK